MAFYTDGYSGDIFSADDTTFNVNWPTFNGGTHGSFAPRGPAKERSLLRFNLAAIPAGSTCVSAKLYLYHKDAPEGAPNPCTGNIYSVASANGDWVAGTKSIALADEDECCWNAKAADGSAGVKTAWAGAVGCGTVGTDTEADAIGSYSVDPGDAIGTEYEIELDTDRVAEWFGGSDDNYGIIIYPTNNSEIHLAQSDYVTTAYRPKLVVEYTEVGGTPPSLLMLSALGGNLLKEVNL